MDEDRAGRRVLLTAEGTLAALDLDYDVIWRGGSVDVHLGDCRIAGERIDGSASPLKNPRPEVRVTVEVLDG